MSLEASERFYAWQAEVETWLGDGGRLFELRDWGGKLCGLTARLAAIIHLVQTDSPEPWNVPVSLPVIESAIVLARWAVPHAEAVIGMMSGSDGPIDDAAYLLRWIREQGLSEFTRRDAHTHGRARFDSEPERLARALDLLSDRGWIRRIADGTPDGPGRPPSPRFIVRPESARVVVPPMPVPVCEPARERGFV